MWENRDSLGAIDRRAGVLLRWRPLPREGVLLIALTSIDPSGVAWGACYCAAAAAVGSFAIPPAILGNLPASHPSPTVPMPSLVLSFVPLRNQQPLHATGLDNGMAISLFAQSLAIQVR